MSFQGSGLLFTPIELRFNSVSLIHSKDNYESLIIFSPKVVDLCFIKDPVLKHKYLCY